MYGDSVNVAARMATLAKREQIILSADTAEALAPWLRARVRVGCRMLDVQARLAARVGDLSRALCEIRTLQGILPICVYCKKIRDDRDYWQRVEDYLQTHTDARFTHSVCPDCVKKSKPAPWAAQSKAPPYSEHSSV